MQATSLPINIWKKKKRCSYYRLLIYHHFSRVLGVDGNIIIVSNFSFFLAPNFLNVNNSNSLQQQLFIYIYY